MNKQKPKMTLFCLSQPVVDTEWASLLGDKFSQAMPFELSLSTELGTAQVIAWNGLLTPKSIDVYEMVLSKLRDGAVLLLLGEARTLFQGHPFVKFADTTNFKVVELPSWAILPEELLNGLELCWEKIKHV